MFASASAFVYQRRYLPASESTGAHSVAAGRCAIPDGAASVRARRLCGGDSVAPFAPAMPVHAVWLAFYALAIAGALRDRWPFDSGLASIEPFVP
jgi:hypothetical protein